MRFVSTRDKTNTHIVGFKEALLNCMPTDGGLYVPSESDNLRNWILYANKNTSLFENKKDGTEIGRASCRERV